MNVLFVADLSHNGTSGSQRCWALKQSVANCSELDISAYGPSLGRITGLLAKSLRSPSMAFNSPALQKAIREACMRLSPEILWLEWARYCTPAFLMDLKKRLPGMRIVSFQDDNPFGRRKGDVWMWRDYLQSVSYFDIHFVKRPRDLEELANRGANNCHLWMHGVYSPIFFPAPATADKKYPLSFVGTCMDGRERLIEALLVAGVDLHVFGTHWEQRSTLPARFPSHFHSAVRGVDYGDVLRTSHICLGLVSHSNQDEWTMRTFEVPGCASMFLAEDTPTHRRLYSDGDEAVFFTSMENCVQLAQKFTTDVERTTQIALAGRKKIEGQGWFLENRMSEILPLLRLRTS